MTTFHQRIVDESADTQTLTLRLIRAAEDAGHYNPGAVSEAIAWAALQLDPEDDDFETWEATVLCRLETGKEER